MIAFADRNEIEPFGADARFKIPHMKQRDPMSALDELATQRAERMNMSGNRWADYAEVQVSEPGACSLSELSMKQEDLD